MTRIWADTRCRSAFRPEPYSLLARSLRAKSRRASFMPDPAEQLQRLYLAGFDLQTFDRFPKCVGVVRDGCIALLVPSIDGLQMLGTPGWRLGEAIGVLVEVGRPPDLSGQTGDSGGYAGKAGNPRPLPGRSCVQFSVLRLADAGPDGPAIQPRRESNLVANLILAFIRRPPMVRILAGQA